MHLAARQSVHEEVDEGQLAARAAVALGVCRPLDKFDGDFEGRQRISYAVEEAIPLVGGR